MTNLARIASSLVEAEPGLWVGSGTETVSYPLDAHRALAEIEDGSFWFLHRSAVIGALLERYPPPGCLFDVGGGNGYMVRDMRRRGIEAILVEPRVDGARTAIERGLQPVVNATLTSAGFRAESLPAVGLFDVVEHIKDDIPFLRQVHDLLQDDGRIYLTVPAYRWLWSVDDVRAGHFRRYTSASLRKVLSRAGFEVDYVSYFFIPLPLAILAARTMPSLLGSRDADAPRASEHRRPSGLIGKGFLWFLDRELWLLSASRAPFGSSILAVARKSRG